MKTTKRIGLALITTLVLLAWSGAPRCETILEVAYTGDVAKAKSLLAANPALVNYKNKHGETPLHYAIAAGKKDMVELLLANKADVNAKNTANGLTPLLRAVRNNRNEIAEVLLAHGADVNATDASFKESPLFWAVRKNNKDMVELLLANKADVNAKNQRGWTPLDVANDNYNNDIAELLRQHGRVEPPP